MTPIPSTFSKHGYTFKLLKRSPKAAIYEQTKGSRLYAYEVHRIRVRASCEFHGKTLPERERLAGDNDFGVHGKTYTVSIVGPGSARISAEAQWVAWSRSEPVGAQAGDSP
jgi:hypothetical protein